MKYLKYELFLKGLEDFKVEVLNLFLYDIGVGGIEEVSQNGADRFFIYLPSDNANSLKSEIEDFSLKNDIQFKILKSEEIDESYLYKWKESYKPIDIGDIFIKPSWIDGFPSGKIVIEIDPQTAFGTGQHETTQLVIKLMLSLLENFSPLSFLDVGTGSGILSLVAGKKGISSITSIDNDFEAVRVAKLNFMKNGLNNFNLICGVPDTIKNIKFDIVAANIISSVLVENKSCLKELVNINGFLIVSGVLREEFPLFKNNFKLENFTWIDEIYMNEWVAAVLKRNY